MREFFVDEEILGRAKGLYLETRKIVGELLFGHHRSRMKGKGTDFLELREYTQGDDPRDMDWKFYGRKEKLMVKVKEDTGRVNVVLCIDDSLSMDFGKNHKLDYAVRLAAAIGYIALLQSDRLLIKTFSGAGDTQPVSSKEWFYEVYIALAGIKPGCRIKPVDFMKNLMLPPGPCKFIVLSDMLYEEKKKAYEFISSFSGAEFDILHIVAEEERTLEGFETAIFKDPEGDGRITVDPSLLRGYYVRAFQEWERELEEAVTENGGFYLRALTTVPLQETLMDYFISLGERR